MGEAQKKKTGVVTIAGGIKQEGWFHLDSVLSVWTLRGLNTCTGIFCFLIVLKASVYPVFKVSQQQLRLFLLQFYLLEHLFSPEGHGSLRLFLRVWCNPIGRAYRALHFCISVSFGEMKVAEFGELIHNFPHSNVRDPRTELINDILPLQTHRFFKYNFQRSEDAIKGHGNRKVVITLRAAVTLMCARGDSWGSF